ncbi:MAG TPA: hypothetical protein VD999_01555 [Vitreimonas sp.]|nr:hypothetical protein [Vitreimonas sp.]
MKNPHSKSLGLKTPLLLVIFLIGAGLLFLYTQRIKWQLPVAEVPYTAVSTPPLSPQAAEERRQLNLQESKTLQVIKVEGVERSYVLHVPENYDRTAKIGVVFAFHGRGNTGPEMEEITQLSGLADQKNFLVVYPTGLNQRFVFSDKPDTESGDVAFTKQILSELAGRYNLDTQHVFALGFSNGGFFVYHLACEQPELFAGFATVGASLPEKVLNTCQPLTARPMLMILGTDDPFMDYALSDTTGTIIPIQQTLKKWTTLNKCQGEPEVFKGAISVTSYSECEQGSVVGLITLQGVDHTWIIGRNDTEFDTSRTIIDFFSSVSSL